MVPPMSAELLTQFIETYRNYPCLWKVKSKEYSNRNLKEAAYNELINLCQTAIPEADKDFVIKKINNLKSAFRKELRKVKEAEHSGMGSEDSYKPKLWYFNLLLFTADQETGRETVDNVPDETDKAVAATSSVDSQDQDLERDTETSTINDENDLPERKKVVSKVSNLKRKIDQKREEKFDIYAKAAQILNAPEDEFDHLGLGIAAKLRKMDEVQRIFCENIINTALYYGQLGKLSENYVLSEKKTQSDSNPYPPSLYSTMPPSSLSDIHPNLTQPQFQHPPITPTSNPVTGNTDGHFLTLQPMENGSSFCINDYFSKRFRPTARQESE